MDTMKDTKMQPATDAVIEELRMLAEDLYVNGYNRYSSAMSQAADELEQLESDLATAEQDSRQKQARIERLEEEESKQAALLDCLNEWKALAKSAEKERDALRAENAALVDDMNLLRNNNTALRSKITEMERQAPARLVTAVAYRWRYRGAVMWQYGELTEETVQVAKEHNHEVQSLGVLPGAKGE